MSFKSIKWAAVLAVALALCVACETADEPGLELAAPSDAPSASESEAPAVPTLYHGETQLHWEAPPGEYHIIETLADENGFAVLYIDMDTEREGLPPSIIVQFFSPQGAHEQTLDTELRGRVEDGPYRTGLTRDGLYFSWSDYYRSIDKATGAISEWRYSTLFSEHGVTLDYSGEYHWQLGTASTRYRLTGADGEVRELIVPEYDENFIMALDLLRTGEPHDDRPGITFTARVSFDAATRTAVISNTKRTYTLNFNDLSYTGTLHYTDEMLGELLAASPSQAVALYDADSNGMGDAVWRDIVLKWRDGSITFLDTCSVLYGVAFFDNDTVVLNKASSLEAYDITAAEPAGRPLLDLGTVDTGGRQRPERLVVGMAIDRDNRLLLAAVRDYTEEWEALLPVTLAVLDASLKPIAALETDCRIMPYRHNWPMRCDIALNGDGTANLSWMDEPPIQVRYLY